MAERYFCFFHKTLTVLEIQQEFDIFIDSLKNYVTRKEEKIQ